MNLLEQLRTSRDLKNFGFLSLVSILARGLQALVPLIIYLRFGTTHETDYYFYWVAQSNLLATFLASCWPAVFLPYLVSLRSQFASEIPPVAGMLLWRFFPFLVFGSLTLVGLSWGGSWGGPLLPKYSYFLVLIGLTSLSTTLTLILGEIGSATRKFGFVFIAQIAAVVFQISVIVFGSGLDSLIWSYVLFTLLQLVTAAFLSRRGITFRDPTDSIPSPPRSREIWQVYAGGITTMLVGHLSYRLLHNYGEGIVSTFALAQMVIAVPQQLVINQLSTIAGVSLAEDTHNYPLAIRWRKILLWGSLLSTFLLLIGALIAGSIPAIFQKLPDDILPMIAFLSLPLAVSGLNTWVARLLMARRLVGAGIIIQLIFQIATILLLFASYSSGANYIGLLSVFPLVAIIYFFTADYIVLYLTKKQRTTAHLHQSE